MNDRVIRVGDTVILNHDLHIGNLLLKVKHSVGVVAEIESEGYNVKFKSPDEIIFVRTLGGMLTKLKV